MSEAAAAPVSTGSKGVPFLKNWVFWTSLVAAVPAGFLLTYIVLQTGKHGGNFSLMMYVMAGAAGIVAFFLTGLPFLVGLGLLMGGKEVAAAPTASPDETATDGDSFSDDDELGDSGFDDDFDSSDGDMLDDDDDDEFDDFDDFE